jgi:hypothetical protein
VTLRRTLWIGLLGLGVVAGAVLPTGLAAQVPTRRDTVSGKRDTAPTRVDTIGKKNLPPTGRDTIRIPLPVRLDTLLKGGDTLTTFVPLPPKPNKDSLKPDTIKAPLARAEAPPILEIGPQRIYDRTALFATGALTLSDFLARVPGLTEFSAGFLAAPVAIASQGNLRNIRIFLDGLELDPMDRRSRGTAPVNDLPLHSLEEIRIERGADEVRVYARSWRVDRTIPYTRADISTGDQNTNMFRAFFGRRFSHGEALQVSADYYNTQADRRLPSSDMTNVMARLGTVRGPWSVDGFFEQSHANRAQWTGTGTSSETQDTVPSLQTERRTTYFRLANGDPDRGRWMQFMASAMSYLGSARSSTDVVNTLPSAADSAAALSDSLSYETQYLVTGGVTKGPLQVSAAERVRVGDHRTSHVLSARASATGDRLAISLFGEGRSYLDPARAEGTVRVAPLRRIAIVAAASRTGSGTFDRLFAEPRPGVVLDPSGVFDPSTLVGIRTQDTAEVTRYALAAQTNLRAEVGIQIRDLWIAAGMLRRGATTLLAPALFDTTYAKRTSVRTEGEATGKTLSVRGRLYKAIQADAWAVKWNDSTGLYRPQYQTRTELFIQTNLLDKFPKGNFGLLTSLAHEYRSNSRFPIGTDSVRIAPGYRALTFKLEIRIQTAIVSYQFRNLLQEKYQQVPGYNFPRQTQIYGVRWEFWN